MVRVGNGLAERGGLVDIDAFSEEIEAPAGPQGANFSRSPDFSRSAAAPINP